MTKSSLIRALGSLGLFALAGLGGSVGCSGSDLGYGNLLAGMACDAFSISTDPACVCCSNSTGNCISGVSPCAPKGASPTCGNPCPGDLTCVEVNGAHVCGVESKCEGPSQLSCGNCGVQSRTCEGGTWSAWSECVNQGDCGPGQTQTCGTGSGTQTCDGTCRWGECVTECQPGQTDTQSCGNCGTTTRTCDASGTWGAYGECLSQGECAPGNIQSCGVGHTQTCDSTCQWGTCVSECQPGQTDTQACEYCGTNTRTCSSEGAWQAWSGCTGMGVCSPGSVQGCGNGGTQSCSAQCAWMPCTECSPDSTQTQSCGQCLSQTRSCSKVGLWGEWSTCSNSGSCTPGTVQSCTGGTQTCEQWCEWGNCIPFVCTPGTSYQQGCGLCGTQTVSCNQGGTWDPPSTCTGTGACEPNTVESCGAGSTHVCGNDCQWGTCYADECTSGSTDTQACGNCGVQTRSCVNAKWTPFSLCQGEGSCKPGTVGSCGNQGSQTCDPQCQWGLCTGQKCDGSFVQSCGICGIQTRTCNNGVWSSFSGCTGERDCIPGTSEACGDGGTRSCNFQCFWDACQ